MRKKTVILMFAALGLSACKQIDKLTQFEMDYSASIVVPSTTGINIPFNVFTPDIETNSESQFSVNDTRKDLVEEVILKSLKLSITSPSDQDFSFLKSIEIYIVADGLEEVLAAWIYDVPASPGNVLNLDTSNNDLKEYIKKESFSLKLVTVTDELITTDYYIDADAVFFVDAKILGI